MTDEVISIKKHHTPLGVYISKQDLLDVLGATIKQDNTNKMILFLGCLLNYTFEDQQNFAFNAPSSTGKSYLALQVSQFFPDEDTLILGYCSPTSFIHDFGEMTREDGSPLETQAEYVEAALEQWYKENPKPQPKQGVTAWNEARRLFVSKTKDEWDEIPKLYVVDLEQKIIVFTDQPHMKLLERLRGLLSHDKKELQYNITDRSKDGKNRTKRVLLKGYPTVIFNTAAFTLEEQEQTRLWLLSPEISQDKLRESLTLITEKDTDRRAFTQSLYEDKRRFQLRFHVQGLKEAYVQQVTISEDDKEYIRARFMEEHPVFKPRHQRDLPRLIALCKAFALFHYNRREMTENRDLIATNEDVLNGYELYSKIGESNEMGLSPQTYELYKEKIEPVLDAGGYMTRRELSRLYFQKYKTRLGEKTRSKMISLLCETGLAVEELHPEDKRQKVIYSPEGVCENFIKDEDGKGQKKLEEASP
ncbi:hypothetical protein MCGE09_00029 [Thaumarchaeota archaeon SCGC AB-539-E09]|nr:hypothetical protein MCGE09_00029 [Thaumarchaeota archaeon SCGC AB-539-E09]